jgi:hypothetical protein
MDNPREGMKADYRESDDIRYRQEQAAKLGTAKEREEALQADSSKIQQISIQNVLQFVYLFLLHFSTSRTKCLPRHERCVLCLWHSHCRRCRQNAFDV